MVKNYFYIGSDNNSSIKVKTPYLGGENNQPIKLKEIYIGGENNEPFLIYQNTFYTFDIHFTTASSYEYSLPNTTIILKGDNGNEIELVTPSILNTMLPVDPYGTSSPEYRTIVTFTEEQIGLFPVLQASISGNRNIYPDGTQEADGWVDLNINIGEYLYDGKSTNEGTISSECIIPQNSIIKITCEFAARGGTLNITDKE